MAHRGTCALVLLLGCWKSALKVVLFDDMAHALVLVVTGLVAQLEEL